MPLSAMPSGLPSKTYRSSADNSLSTFSYFMDPVRPVTASTSTCHTRSTASTTRRQYVSSCPDSLYASPLFSEVRDDLLHDQRTALRIGAGINPILVGDGRDFRIAHAAHARHSLLSTRLFSSFPKSPFRPWCTMFSCIHTSAARAVPRRLSATRYTVPEAGSYTPSRRDDTSP